MVHCFYGLGLKVILSNAMQVAEVRRCLLAVRSAWSKHSPETPLNLTQMLPNGMPVDVFCYNFMLNHHNKRMQRLKQESHTLETQAEEEEDVAGVEPGANLK